MKTTQQKFIPILFSTAMVQAILEGRKTMTRRIVKMKDGSLMEDEDLSKHIDGSFDKVMDFTKTYPYWQELKCPYGDPHDVLWVRETTTILEPEHCMGGMDSRFVYKTNMCADSEEARQDYIRHGYPYKWIPSIFMKKEACRLFLQIKNIKVERLQDISEADAIAEGVDLSKISGDYEHTPACEFEVLWKSINGAESWDANPWVWCIEFNKIDKPENFI